MKGHSIPNRNQDGFTLLEMIAAITIIGILASVIIPNLARQIDIAAVRAESKTLETFAESLKTYVSVNRRLPKTSNWAAAISEYADASKQAIERNKRMERRVYIEDPGSNPSERVIILSNLRTELSLPKRSDIRKASRFQALWDTVDGKIPSTKSWKGWSRWKSVERAGNYLLIERINLRKIYETEFKTRSVAINNTTKGTTSYEAYGPDGKRLSRRNLAAGATITLNSLVPGSRVKIFRKSGRSGLIYTHIVSDQDATFDLSSWISSSKRKRKRDHDDDD